MIKINPFSRYLFLKKMIREKINQNTIVRRTRLTAYRRVCNYAIVMKIRGKKLYKLNEIATCIWDTTIEPVSVKKIHQVICQRYNISSKKSYNDLLDFLSSLIKKNLLTLDDQ